jgi:pyridoxamine 5'-phosphate oxidase
MEAVIATNGGPGTDPMGLARLWYQGAVASQVENAALLALATADSRGHASNRIVRILEFRDEGLVFTTHAGSLKGRQLAETGWSSGVFYWPEIGQQVIVSGPTYPLPDDESDALWDARPVSTHPMSAASMQSNPLRDEDELRRKAAELQALKEPLPRPSAFKAYQIEPAQVEFWHNDQERLHHRLKYTRIATGWRVEQLQP